MTSLRLKRLETRQALIAKLFYSMLKKFNANNTNISFKIDNNSVSSRLHFNSKTIELGLQGVKYTYKDDYYEGRGNKLNVINNRHDGYRFILLHELNHYLYLDDLAKYWCNVEQYETLADDFALCYLKAF